MKVDTMRKIDHHVGIPLCFLLGLWFKVKALISKPIRQRPRNILFIELSEMGSAIIADPAMRKAKAEGAELFFVIFKDNVHSLRLLQTVPEANIFKLGSSNLFDLALDSLKFLFWCRKNKIDTTVDLELFSRFTALLSGLSGSTNRVGYDGFHNEGLYRGNFLTHKVSYNPHIHIAKNFMALIHAAFAQREEIPFSKIKIEDAEVKIAQATCSETDKLQVIDKIKGCYPAYQPDSHRIILINPNASDLLPQRRWMPEYFVQVMQHIVQSYPDTLVLITGAPSESAQAERLRQQVNHERCINFAGQVGFQQLIPLYYLSTLMLTNDSGPGHFSSVTPLRTFVIFGPETPALYSSLGNSTAIFAGLACSPCVSASNHRKTPCEDNRCLQVITPESVIQTLTPALESEIKLTQVSE
ncbi:ADP-heptose:LPS heptosyltransferase [Oceanospirillum multiglobuliferum]|uniref:Glycosyl transferase n=1 Tax=Oceanospirillum multiglobuliferum TaxID=64969 RepID=A0A1T4QD36_9GAMM|nr:glycosyltransferase family 9 protein [Oceanospirillum multiglobuliferum]OPX56515.1 glycosyl transferase [Oceanospirillum multiglobuliferum]SKA01441.1 ADP-heptose:LPS heptosyltransferase [Oceanospirillum multiglobuliferum]